MNHSTQGIYSIKAFEARDLPHKKLSKSKRLLKLRIIWFPLLQDILQGALLQEEKLPPAERADLEENSTKRSQVLCSPPSPLGCFLPTISQTLDMVSGQEGREVGERSK